MRTIIVRLFLFLLLAFSSNYCNKAEALELDASKSPLGFALDISFAQAGLDFRSIQYDSSSIAENQSLSVLLHLNFTPPSPVTVTYTLDSASSGISVGINPNSGGVSTITGSGSDYLYLNVPADSNCVGGSFVLKAVRSDTDIPEYVTFTVSDPDLCLFVLNNGGSHYQAVNFNGILGADQICAQNVPSATNYPGDPTEYKAMLAGNLVGGGIRRMDDFSFFRANTKYVKFDGATWVDVMSSGTAAPIVNFGGGGSLTNAISTFDIWTGITGGWATSPNNCQDASGSWRNNSSYGNYGQASLLTINAVGYGAYPCSTGKDLVCVRVP
ncbi:hypothetical protein CH373_17415 [Leptospira perolatii]|uniref:DUF1554 domain-containing protein n=1 Tax=Leptospira perolatii TaxID=2023191 RepID=A0A2M9ZID3_9LEPT|nr:DUF1554 domain-containing protein [Leptospira perolatii]PJZ68339.1 hypothetical protein CH360_16700 [Leptospira perolatii]PJZ71827.1 hypothetical protein CH373_17415 [Leptospira perolatii]